MWYLYHGENNLELREAVRALLGKLLPGDTATFNMETLTAPFTLNELQRACATMPFLADVRTIIVPNSLGKDKGKGKGKSNDRWLPDLLTYLPTLPATAHVLFTEDKTLPAKHTLLQLAKEETQGKIRSFPLPNPRELPQWIVERAQQHGSPIERPAAALLAENLGADLRLLDQELRKLATYRGDERAITVADVRLLTPYVMSADVIFKLVDALGKRDPRQAAQHLHRLLDAGEHPLGIMAMVTRQFRLLIQARWLMDTQRSSGSQIAQRLKQHEFVGGKLRDQATSFTQAQLRQAYTLLLDSDLAIKQGQLQPEAALDLLVAELTRL